MPVDRNQHLRAYPHLHRRLRHFSPWCRRYRETRTCRQLQRRLRRLCNITPPVLRRAATVRTHAMARPRAAVCATVPLRCHAAQVVLKDLRAICSRAAAEGFEVVEGLAATAPPSGTVRRDTYEAFKQEILAQCSAALPIDGVVLGLHGAMVAHGYDDVEGDLLSDVRALVGVECVIGVEFDPHMHLTQRRFDNADILIAYKEFPHVDMIERAEEVVDLTLRTIHGTTFTTTRSHNNYPRSHLT